MQNPRLETSLFDECKRVKQAFIQPFCHFRYVYARSGLIAYDTLVLSMPMMAPTKVSASIVHVPVRGALLRVCAAIRNWLAGNCSFCPVTLTVFVQQWFLIHPSNSSFIVHHASYFQVPRHHTFRHVLHCNSFQAYVLRGCAPGRIQRTGTRVDCKRLFFHYYLLLDFPSVHQYDSSGVGLP